MEEKDFSLLRPFDLGAAKRGGAICGPDGQEGRWVGVSKSGKSHIIEAERDEAAYLGYASDDALRMAPLGWVEGKPVYKGDRLYWGPEEYIISGASEDGNLLFSESHAEENGELPCPAASSLTWNPPKREVKLLAYLDCDQLFWLRDTAEPKWAAVRVPSEDKVIEVEA